MARRDRDRRKLDDALEEIGSLLQVVKTEYEMYFMGILKRAPEDKHRDLKRSLREVQEQGGANTSQQFKLKVLWSRYNSLALLWGRTCHQIEDGTYKRHRVMADHREVARAREAAAKKRENSSQVQAQIRALIRGETPAPEPEPVPPPPPAASLAPSPARIAAQPAPSARPPQSRGHAAGSRELVQEFADVRRQLGLQGQVNAAALEEHVRKQVEAVKARTGCSDVRFRVVAEDGKPKLKAIPIR